MSYSNKLPAPGSLINAAGAEDAINGLPAPGFAGLGFTSNYEVSLNRTRSNRGFPVSNGMHYWAFSIKYHPMTMEEYEALEAFLYGYNTRENPFYVTLPNYSGPRDSQFRTWAESNTIGIDGSFYAGDKKVMLNTSGALGKINPGSFINFIDPEDALHKSTYKVGTVETQDMFAVEQPAFGRTRVGIFPPLQRELSPSTTVRVINPEFRVIQKNNITPEYDENNIVSINLDVEEILP